MTNSKLDSRSKKLIKFLAGQVVELKWLYISTLILWTGVYGLPLIIGALTSNLIDEAGHKIIDPQIWLLLAYVVGLMVLRALFLLGGLQLTFKLIFKVSSTLKIDILDRLLKKPSEMIFEGTGEILNRLRDDSEELGGLLEWSTDLIYRSVLVVIAVVVLTKIDMVMTIPLLLLFAGVFISVFLKNRVLDLQGETRKQQGQIGAIITDSLKGIRDLRLANTVEDQLHQLEQRFSERREVLVRQQFFVDLLSDLFRNLVIMGTTVVLLTMAIRIESNGFDVGKLVIFLMYSSWLGQQMYFFGAILARFQNGKIAYTRLNELYTYPQPKSVILPESIGPLNELLVKNLTYKPTLGVFAPVPISFSAKPGELIAITGEVGSGKSRALHCLLGLNSDILGKVFWNGNDITGDSEWMRAPRIAYVGQSSLFFSGTIAENITLGSSDISSTNVETALNTVELSPGSVELPLGLDTVLDSGDADSLSGGQRQRLALARMIVRSAELYIVDDCDSSLDGPTAHRIWQRVKSDRKAIWIVVSKNPSLLTLANKVITVTKHD